MQLIRNKNGFSLAELVVTLAISGFMTLMIMRYSLDSLNQESQMRYLKEVNESLSLLQNYFSRPDQCTGILKGKTISSAGDEITHGLILPLSSGTKTLLTVGDYPNYKVTSIRLAESQMGSSSFDLVISFTPKTTSIINSYFAPSNSNIVKRMTLIGTLDGSTVKNCGPIISDTNEMAKTGFCSALGDLASWDSANQKCKLNSNFKCNDGEVPVSLRSNGTLNCMHIGSQIIYTNVFNFTPKTCPSKNYALYQNQFGRITVGCPNPGEAFPGELNR